MISEIVQARPHCICHSHGSKTWMHFIYKTSGAHTD